LIINQALLIDFNRLII